MFSSFDLRGLQTCRALARNKEWNQRINASSIWITKGYKLLSCVTITTKASVAHCDTECFGNPPNAKTAWFENAILKKKFFFLSLYQSLYLIFFLILLINFCFALDSLTRMLSYLLNKISVSDCPCPWDRERPVASFHYSLRELCITFPSQVSAYLSLIS